MAMTSTSRHAPPRRVRKATADLPTFTHLNADGAAHLVDVSKKHLTVRVATATASVVTTAAVIRAIRRQAVAKGDVIAVARIAGIQAAKRTDLLIPLCHQVALDAVTVELRLVRNRVVIVATAQCQGRTGVEMEALTAASVAALTVYDMCKAIDRGMTITDVGLVAKSGGRSGSWSRSSQANDAKGTA